MKLKDKYNNCVGRLYSWPKKRWVTRTNLHAPVPEVVPRFLLPLRIYKYNGWWCFECQIIGDGATDEFQRRFFCKEFLRKAVVAK
jgi:hypothetical protein